MAIPLTSQNPGVYIHEVPSGARPIEAAGTSTPAFIGYVPHEPMMSPQLVEDYDEYTDIFGTVSPTGGNDGAAMAFAVQAFFDNGGRQAYVVNVALNGKSATGDLVLARVDPRITIYEARAFNRGEHGNGLEVWLTPKGGPQQAIFDCSVRRSGDPQLLEEYFDVTIAPGLPNSVENALAAAKSRVTLTPHADLQSKVYPSVEIDFSTEFDFSDPTASTERDIEISGLGGPDPITFGVDFKDAGRHSGEELAAACTRLLNRGFAEESRPESTDFVCELVSGNTVRILLRCEQRDATFRLGEHDAAQTRGELVAALLSDVEFDNRAVASGDTSGIRPSDLNGHELVVQFGNDFARAVALDGFTANATLADIAAYLQSQLEGPLPLYKDHLPSVSAEPTDQVGRVRFDSTLPDSSVEGQDVTEQNGYWLIDVPAAIPDGTTWTLTLKVHENTHEVTIDVGGLGTIENIADAVEAALVEFTADPPTGDIHVEAIGDRLLLWHSEADISVLETMGAELLSLTAAQGAMDESLSSIQPELPLMATLRGGEDLKQGTPGDYDTALAALELRDEVSMLVLPGHPWDKKSRGSSSKIVEKAIQHAERMGDRMVIVDPPYPQVGEEWQDRETIRQHRLPGSKFAAVYYPWVDVGDETLVAPGGFAAGIWARTDETRGVWKAPAGVEARLKGVRALQHAITDAESDALNREGVNTLRAIPVDGPVVWGARTRSVHTAPQWKYVPVRRLALMIEDSLRTSMLWAVHEPNRQELWAALRANIGAFLGRLHRLGAFQPDRPRDAYFVRCGPGSTMPQADIDAGIVRVRVGFAPVRPAEFVVITLEQITEG